MSQPDHPFSRPLFPSIPFQVSVSSKVNTKSTIHHLRQDQIFLFSFGINVSVPRLLFPFRSFVPLGPSPPVNHCTFVFSGVSILHPSRLEPHQLREGLFSRDVRLFQLRKHVLSSGVADCFLSYRQLPFFFTFCVSTAFSNFAAPTPFLYSFLGVFVSPPPISPLFKRNRGYCSVKLGDCTVI